MPFVQNTLTLGEANIVGETMVEVFNSTPYMGQTANFDPEFLIASKRKGYAPITSEVELRFSAYEEWYSVINIHSDGQFVLEENDIIKITYLGFIAWGKAFEVVALGDNFYEFSFLYGTDMYTEEAYRDEASYAYDDIVAYIQEEFESCYIYQGNDSSDNPSILYKIPSIGFRYTTDVPTNPMPGTLIMQDRSLGLDRCCKQMLIDGFRFNTYYETNTDATGTNPTSYLVTDVSYDDSNSFNINLDGLISYDLKIAPKSYTILRAYIKTCEDCTPTAFNTYYALSDGTITDTMVIDQLIYPYNSKVNIWTKSDSEQTITDFQNAVDSEAKSMLKSESFNNNISITFKRDTYIYYDQLFSAIKYSEFDIVGRRGIIHMNGIDVQSTVGGISIIDNIITVSFNLPDKKLF